MASIANAFVNPFRQSFRYVQRQAHENPVITYAIAVGATGPLAVLIVPPIRRRLGYVSPPRPPTTYPLPRRERDAELSGFDDPEDS